MMLYLYKNLQRFFTRNKEIMIGLSIILLPLVIIITYKKARLAEKLNFVDSLVLSLSGPIENLLSDAVYQVAQTFHKYLYLTAVYEKNVELQKQMKELKLKLLNHYEIRLQNERLSELLKFQQNFQEYNMVAAKVIGVNPSAYIASIRINAGEEQLLTKSMVVVTPDGVVGRITRVSQKYSDVLLILDPKSSLDVVVQKNREKGRITGSSDMYQSLLNMEYVKKTADLKSGDTIITSGIGEVYPAGFPVGSIVSIENKPEHLFFIIKVKPAVNLDRIEEVMVITNFKNAKNKELIQLLQEKNTEKIWNSNTTPLVIAPHLSVTPSQQPSSFIEQVSDKKAITSSKTNSP